MGELKILDKTKQQRLDYLQSKIYLLKELWMTEREYALKEMKVGELFVKLFWEGRPVLQLQLLTNERLEFWTSFKYEWFKHDIVVVNNFCYKGIRMDIGIQEFESKLFDFQRRCGKEYNLRSKYKNRYETYHSK
ncbi:MAG: hypothetical protein ACRCR9_01330 [Chitinophagaceae bacterium]